MLSSLLSMFSYSSYSGGAAGDLFAEMEMMGFFSIILPFLFIFSVVFISLGVLKVFKENKKVNAIVSLVVGLMAVQSHYVSDFFANVMPRLGIGLVIIFVILILIGLFMEKNNKGINITLFVIAGIIALFVLFNSAEALGWTWFSGFRSGGDWVSKIIVAIIVISAIALITSDKEPKDSNSFTNPLIHGGNN